MPITDLPYEVQTILLSYLNTSTLLSLRNSCTFYRRLPLRVSAITVFLNTTETPIVSRIQNNILITSFYTYRRFHSQLLLEETLIDTLTRICIPTVVVYDAGVCYHPSMPHPHALFASPPTSTANGRISRSRSSSSTVATI